MNIITALAVSVGLLGGLATYAFLADHLGLGLQIWAAFLAWGCFYHCGGKTDGLRATVFGNLWGVLMALVTLIVISQTGVANSLTLPVWAGICVAVGVGLMILGSQISIFSSIPAAVYGYAAAVAFALLWGPGLNNLLDPSLQNPAVIIAISMIIGGILGYISEMFAGTLAKN